ncbi:hypothetical protein A1O7_04383 [Cladophialophora yegresii CBS 114405]|uniref:Uncharacterized protein n=1 Tax=Cladophialophora yegresii CBS 114405 TaxID=1182544 RepID=W9W6S7_9EURO|nr:uncharacterized protein A1O7_04383 [Cladophialophora yegresii CBS 114405]EXJ60231.1 hypothetical protein A1O7_04383 [Cladophialophora yegresii CBS 114405]
MAEVNGVPKHEGPVTASLSHLGKRKRTISPQIEEVKDAALQSTLQHVLQLLRKHDTTPSLLKYPLPPSNFDLPGLKRARLVKSESANGTIEDRILTGTYKSIHALKDDVKNVRDAILSDASTATQNGTTKTDVQGQLSTIMKVLEQYDLESSGVSESKGETTLNADRAEQKPKQFLSLRSNVNGVAHVLFSGLQVQQHFDKVEPDALPEVVGTGLPNGFELTDYTALSGNEEVLKKQEKRTFEKVFATVRRLKPLDLPHTAKDVVRGNTLDFIPNSSRAENLPLNKHDYKFAKLPTSSYLSYRHSQQERKRIQPSSSSADFKAALASNNGRQEKAMSEEALYSSVYSSFAPSSDNSYSLISQEDLSRQWWSQNGEHKLSRLFRTTDQHSSPSDGEAEGSDEFADVVANFEPQEPEEVQSHPTEKEVDSLLEEVSEMIETLSSYQRNRSLDHLVAGRTGKPETPEFDTFEMLRDQLSVLVASLPPFAVAKLNGDQLDDLNISTRLVVEVPDYPGTGQPDDYILRRQKMAQQATQAVTRSNATPQPVRPSYSSVQANTMSYNSGVRNYGTSVPATAAFGMRTTQPHQTPTASRSTYPQTSTFPVSTGNSYSANRPTVQQFQRPAVQNGYGSYGGNTPLQPSQQQSRPQTPAGGYSQRPTQPGYQQRAQETAAVLARSASPQKPQPLVNGSAQHYTPRPYQAQTLTQQGPSSQGQQTGSFAYQRQGSGTPTTPIAPGAAAARHDGGGGDRTEGAQSGRNGPATQNSIPQLPQQNQTVEVSR